MISLTQLAEKYENELNAIVADKDELWSFKIHALTGRIKPNERDGNYVYEKVDGFLSVNSSALTANILTMGINYLTLEFLIKEEPPRTSATQTAEELATVQDEQVYFPNHVNEIINDYFQSASVAEITDDDGTVFSIGQTAGIATTGIVDIYPVYGRAVPVTVSLTLNFVEGGTNALNIKLYIDGEQIPCTSIVPSRSTALETNVHSGETAQTHWASSDVFGIDITFPSTSNTAVKRLINEFVTGESINMAHFVRIIWGDIADKYYLMQVTSVQGSAEGASFAGIQMSLGQAPRDLSAVNFPSCYSVYAISTEDSTATSVTLLLGTNIVTSSLISLTSGMIETNYGSFDYDNDLSVGDYVYFSKSNTIGQITALFEDEDTVDVTFLYDLSDTSTLYVLAASTATNGCVYSCGNFYDISSNSTDSIAVSESDFIDVTTDAESETYSYSIYIVALNATLIGTEEEEAEDE